MQQNFQGQRFANYQLSETLGEGGFARVYRARDVNTGKDVALKIFKGIFPDQDSLDKLGKEADITKSLVHPHIVRVHQFAIEGNVPYMVMDYIPFSWRQKHQMGVPLPLDRVVQYTSQLCSALQYAHDNRVVHRDLKPANLLLNQAGDVLLGDFGIARVLTTTGYDYTQHVSGTLQYMAPEAFEGAIERACDQYSLGIMVYEWLTGKRPFEGTFTELWQKHVYTAPEPLRKIIPTLPEAVEQVVLQALAKKPHQRFQTVQAFATKLEQAVRPPAQASHAHPNSPPQAQAVNVLPPQAKPAPPGQPIVPPTQQAQQAQSAPPPVTPAPAGAASPAQGKSPGAAPSPTPAPAAPAGPVNLPPQPAMGQRVPGNLPPQPAAGQPQPPQAKPAQPVQPAAPASPQAGSPPAAQAQPPQAPAGPTSSFQVIAGQTLTQQIPPARAAHLPPGAAAAPAHPQGKTAPVPPPPAPAAPAPGSAGQPSASPAQPAPINLPPQQIIRPPSGIPPIQGQSVPPSSPGRSGGVPAPGSGGAAPAGPQNTWPTPPPVRPGGTLPSPKFNPSGMPPNAQGTTVPVSAFPGGAPPAGQSATWRASNPNTYEPPTISAWGSRRPDSYPHPTSHHRRSAPKGTKICVYWAHASPVREIYWFPDGSQILSLDEQIAHTWETSLGTPGSAATLLYRNSSWSPDRVFVAYLAVDGISVYDMLSQPPNRLSTPYRGHQGEARAVAWVTVSTSRCIASAGTDQSVHVWDPSNGQPIRDPYGGPYQGIYRVHVRPVTHIVASPDGRLIASAEEGGNIQVWEPHTGHTISSYTGHQETLRHQGSINALHWSPDGEYIASQAGREIRVWDIHSGKTLAVHEVSPAEPLIRWSPDRRRIASRGKAGRGVIEIWDPTTGRTLRTCDCGDPVTSLAWSPNGNILAAGAGRAVYLWDARSGVRLFSYASHTAPVTSVAWSPDGNQIASGDAGDPAAAQTGHPINAQVHVWLASGVEQPGWRVLLQRAVAPFSKAQHKLGKGAFWWAMVLLALDLLAFPKAVSFFYPSLILIGLLLAVLPIGLVIWGLLRKRRAKRLLFQLALLSLMALWLIVGWGLGTLVSTFLLMIIIRALGVGGGALGAAWLHWRILRRL
jgi:serine/threonine protein kinase/WD40 repeat protein